MGGSLFSGTVYARTFYLDLIFPSLTLKSFISASRLLCNTVMEAKLHLWTFSFHESDL